MKVVLKEKSKPEFISFDIGDCFKFNGELYLKTTIVNLTNFNDNKLDWVNAVNLKQGTYAFFDEDSEVEKVDAEVWEV